MPRFNDEPHANGDSEEDSFVVVKKGNGSEPYFTDSAQAESDLALRYIGENYDEDQTSNYDEVKNFSDTTDQYAKEHLDEETYNRIKSRIKITSATVDTFVKYDVFTTLADSQTGELFNRAVNFHYKAFLSDKADHEIHLMCASLFLKDYACSNVKNQGGSLCWNYPENINIPVGVKMNDPNSSNEYKIDPKSTVPDFLENFDKYCEKAEKAALARCRCRFPVPVILYNGKFICRSGTLSVRKGAMFEAFRKAPEQGASKIDKILDYLSKLTPQFLKNIFAATVVMIKGVDEMKFVDASMLKMLKIKYICDLMVEDRKVHTGMNVSSSEKINMFIYGALRCLQIPYPGCEFFRKYHKIRFDPNYEQVKRLLIFDWESPEVNSTLKISKEEELPSFPFIKWDDYKTWDLDTLTKNYLRLLLHYLKEGDGGLLVHCISGWDRTPLFICLLRVSLWADDLIHSELDVDQMAYFTMGYDWYLFGHDLPNRLKKKEEIMHFCFKFLPLIASSEYSINSEPNLEKVLNRRKYRLEALSQRLLKYYEDEYAKYSEGTENPKLPVDPVPAE